MREYGWTSEQYDEQPSTIVDLAEMVVRVEGEQRKKDEHKAKQGGTM